jgi:hypothetical protein
MMGAILRSTIQLLICALLVVGSGLKVQAQSAAGYFLNQASPMEGPFQVRVSPAGLRLDLKQISVIIQPSNGSAILMNRKKRTWCLMSDQELLTDYHSKFACGQLKPGGATSMNGYPAKQWFGQAYDTTTKKPVFMVEMFTTQSLKLPKRVEDDCADVMGVPKGFGWPLRVVHYTNYGTASQKQEVMLQTSEVRPMTTSAADFAPISGYTQVKNKAEVATGMSQSDIDDLLKDLDK